MPLPIVEPTRTATALQSPRCRGSRSPQASRSGSMRKYIRGGSGHHLRRIQPQIMKEPQQDLARLLRRLSWTGAVLGFGLIVLGGVVRITGSGMGCGDHWPRCNGEWFPPLDLPTLIEIGHRWAAALVSVAVFAIALVAWVRHRAESSLRNPATLALGLLIAQVL